MRRTLFVLAGMLLLGATALFAILCLLTPPRVRAPDARSWVFHNVTIVEPGVPARPGSTLIVDDGRISRTGDPDRGRRERRQSAPDLDGLYVAPGLIDMYVHYPPRIAVGNRALCSLLLLAHGVTSIRETGSIDGSIFAEREAIASGHHPGPRIFACGQIIDGPHPSFPSNVVVRSAEEARAAVRAQVRAGADCIKIYNMLEPEPLEAIVATAASVGLPVIGHKPHSVPTRQAGIVDLQHGTGVVSVNRARIGRLDFRYEGWAALYEARLAEAIALSRALGIAHTPTLINSAMRCWLVGSGASPGQIAGDSGLRHLPRFWQGVWRML